MSKPRHNSAPFRFVVALLALVAAWSSGGFLSLTGFGVTLASASPLYVVPATSVTVPASGSATLQVRGIALQPGSAVPAASLGLAGQPVPAEMVRTALYYGINWGYTESDPEQAVLAVWYAQDQTWRNEKHNAAEQIYSAAASSPGTPSWSPNGRSALQVASSGHLKLSEIAFVPSQQTPAMGSGELRLTNTSSQELLVHLPYGTIFGEGPSAVLVWAVGAVAEVAASATPEEAAQPTDTVEIVESTATDTPVPTATSTVAAPGSPGKKGPSTPTNTPAPVQETPVEPSPTTETATKGNAYEAATALPENTSTPAPTDTTVPTDTTAPTDTPTPEPTSTATPVPPTPTTDAAASKGSAQNEQKSAGAAEADVAAPQTEQTQSNAATNEAPTGKQPSKGQGSVQAPPAAQAPAGSAVTSTDATDAQVQAPVAANDSAGKPSIQEKAEVAAIAGEQSSNTDAQAALAPAITLTAAPRAVQTSQGAVGNNNAAPRAIQTSGATPPAPVETGNATAPAGTGVATSPTAIRTGTPTRVRTSTPGTTPTTESVSELSPTASDPIFREPTEEVQDVPTVPVRETEAPTQAPIPTPFVEIQPTATTAVPEIVTGGDEGVQVGSNGGGEVPAVGPTPQVNPNTGGGPSSLPLWLSLSSLALVLSGFQLRRLAAKQHPANGK